MSAFIVSTETMQRVIAAITNNGQSYDGIFAGVHLFRTSADLDELGNALFALNVEAMHQRYSDPSDVAPSFSYRPLGQVSKEDRYMAVACLLYQCSEGNVPESAMYKELERVRDGIADAIAHDAAIKAGSPWDWAEFGEDE